MEETLTEYERQTLNGVYAMLADTLRVWHYLHGDTVRMTAALILKDVYAYELHASGGGCAWRKPEWDRERAAANMTALGLDPARFDENAVLLALLLDGDPDGYERASGRIVPPTGGLEHPSDLDGVVEDLHNAFRRITVDWDRELDRPTMRRHLDRLEPMAAHAIRVERDGGEPDLKPMLDLCRKGDA